MKAWTWIGIAALVMVAGFLAGCLDEVLDPDVDFSINEAKTAEVSPPPVSVNATDGHHYVFVNITFINDNDDTDVILGPGSFTLDDNNVTTVDGKYLANLNGRDIGDSISVDPGSEKTFWVIFEVQDGLVMEYMRYEGPTDEPVEKEMPNY